MEPEDLIEEDELEIEEIEEEDEGPKAPDDVPLEEDERENYSKNVQKRIKQLTYEKHAATRAKEEADREREEAIRVAKVEHERAQQLSSRLEQGEGVLVEQAIARRDAEIAGAKERMRAAHEAGDTDALVNAQEEMAKAASERTRAAAMQNLPKAPPMPEPQFRQQPQRPQISEKTAAWISENDDWFQKDRRMTNYAMVVHGDLVNSGVDPESDGYYTKIDEEMKNTFPAHFGASGNGASPPNKKAGEPGTVVAAPTRTSGKKPRKVRLTKAQVAVAKKIGVPLEEYAKQVMLLKEADNG